MPTSFHSRRGSYPAPLPYHQRTSKLTYNKPQRSTITNWRLRWLLLLALITFLLYLLLPSTSSSSSAINFANYPELDIAQQYQPIPPSTGPIPKVVHFVYGLKGPDPTLDWIHYFAIKSAHDRLQPTRIMFHYHYMPTGPVFELARPYLTMSKVDLATTTAPFGDRPVTHFAHQADLVRLAMLEQYGGIYLDLDVIVMASMDHLLDHEFIMGQEGIDGSVGLCNAVILARPHARFLQRWQQTYRTFDQSDWNYHSVVLPGKLAPAFPHEITIMNHTTFFWPLWDSPGLRTLFLEKSYTFDDNLATHIWESAANPHLMTGLEPDVIRHVDNSLYCQLRLLLSPDDEQPIRPCRILTHSNRSDQLVGHWSLAPPSDPTLLRINPTPAQDDSGNDMHGIIRNGYFNTPNDGVYVSGQDSYIFLSMPTQLTVSNLTIQWQMKRTDDLIKNGTVLMVQMDECKLIIKPNTIETWILMDWTWELASSVLTINNNNNNNDDDQYHLYTLVIRHDGSLLLPDLVVYKDGYVWASQVSWQYTSIVRGLWFGSAEPNKYQDPWDTTLSLAAWYKDIKVWERALVLHDIRTDAFKNANIQSWPPLNVD